MVASAQNQREHQRISLRMLSFWLVTQLSYYLSYFKKIEETGEELNFILVDGDHSKLAVYNNLKMILDYPHKYELTILVHDRFYPQSRKGMKMVDFANYEKVEYIELDYIHGNFWHNDTYREMWGGFALFKLGKGGIQPM